MNIFTLMSRNWRRGPQTQVYPARQAPAPAYRGHVVLEPDACRSCSKCAQVCVSAAITFNRVEGDLYAWAYDPARCTFCGLCVTYCPADCLAQEPDRSPAYTTPGEQATTVSVVKRRKKKAASRAPAPPAPQPVPQGAHEGTDHGC